MILAADFGGTSIKVGLVDSGRVLGTRRLAVSQAVKMGAHLETVAEIWEDLLGAEGMKLGDCAGASLALPFVAEGDGRKVVGDFDKFPEAGSIDFVEWGARRLGLGLAMENDLRVALLGEWTYGAAKGTADAVMFAMGTGIGCAVIANGRLYRGANNRAACILGHSSIDYDGDIGRCGNRGCAEDLASTATLGRRARSRGDYSESRLSSVGTIDFESVCSQAQQGDSCARGLLGESLNIWAALVQNAVLAYDPEVVVLGGGVMRSRDAILPFIEEHLRLHMPCLPLQATVRAACMGDEAALVGGEVLYMAKYLRQ